MTLEEMETQLNLLRDTVGLLLREVASLRDLLQDSLNTNEEVLQRLQQNSEDSQKQWADSQKKWAELKKRQEERQEELEFTTGSKIPEPEKGN